MAAGGLQLAPPPRQRAQAHPRTGVASARVPFLFTRVPDSSWFSLKQSTCRTRAHGCCQGSWREPEVLEWVRGSPLRSHSQGVTAGHELRLLLPAQRDRKPGLRDGSSLVEPWLRSQERLALGAWVRSLHLSLPPFPLQKEDGSTCVENFREDQTVNVDKASQWSTGKG